MITPNPFTSGGAQWNIMAAYGAQLEQGKSDEEAIDYLRELFLEHVPSRTRRARGAPDVRGRQGRRHARLRERGHLRPAGRRGLDYVVPEQTILIENPAAVVNTGESPEAAEAFLEYLYTPEAQAVFAAKGYRPVVEGVGRVRLSGPAGLFHDRGRRRRPDVRTRFFDREESIFLDIENELGVPTEQQHRCGQAAGAPRNEARRRPGAGALDGVPHADRADPDRGGRRLVARGRVVRILGSGDFPGGGRGAQARSSPP